MVGDSTSLLSYIVTPDQPKDKYYRLCKLLLATRSIIVKVRFTLALTIPYSEKCSFSGGEQPEQAIYLFVPRVERVVSSSQGS